MLFSTKALVMSRKPQLNRILIALTAPLLLASADLSAGVQRHEARIHQAGWSASAEGMSCLLRHEIPGYGRVEFRRHGAKDLAFSVMVKRPPLLRTEAELSSDPPGWKHDAALRELDPIDAKLSSYPFTVKGAAARRVFAELENGMAPSLRYQDWADGLDQVEVSISPLFFRPAQREFLECIRDFSSFGMAEGKPTRVYFELNSARLTELGREVLEQAVQFLKKNRGTAIMVDGHASSEGGAGYNQSLSRKRAIIVRNYLMKRGVRRDRFILNFFGDTKPIASNETELGRIKNRRVELRESH